ncbi:MAG: gluconate 2-dehydrogenase subunit 3 family protein [Bacteroidota bacterium]
MTRRDILKYTAYATGAVVATPLLTSLLSGCQADGGPTVDESYQAHFFGEEDMKLLTELVDIILPKTDSPAASEVGVPKLIDSMVGTVYQQADKASYQKGFEALKQSMADASDKSAVAQSLITDSAQKETDAGKAFLHLRQQTIAYYLSTEEIGKNYLNYLPIPGEYQACIDLAEVDGKAWAI